MNFFTLLGTTYQNSHVSVDWNKLSEATVRKIEYMEYLFCLLNSNTTIYNFCVVDQNNHLPQEKRQELTK